MNRWHYERYLEDGLIADSEGDYQLARKNFATAVSYAQIGFLGAESESTALYNYARMSGMLGKFDEAELAIKRSLELLKSNEPSIRALRRHCELARLYQAWNKHALAVASFTTAVSIGEKVDLEKLDPIGFADFLVEFARSLEKEGETQRAKQILARAAAIRSANPGAVSQTEVHPYPVK